MNRMRALLAAGGLTGLVLGTLLALGFGPDRLASAMDRRPTASTVEMKVEGAAALPATGPADAGTLMEQNRQLKDALELMQAREAEYRRQIEQANQALGQVERAAASGTASDTYAFADEDDGDHGEDHDKAGHEDEYDDGKHESHEERESHDD